MTNAFANHIGYSDVTPFEVVRTISDVTLEIREMNAVRSNPENKLGFAPGGFLGHCSNQDEQEWTITSDLDRPVKRIRLNKRGQWKDKYGNRYALSNKPRKFYDYNF
jgi:hypothetical protein